MIKRKVIVGVMGSGTHGYESLAGPLGTLLATSGFHLLTGGGSGVMAEVSRAFCRVPERRGSSIGIVKSTVAPALDEHTNRRGFRPDPMNPWLDIPILTHLPLSGTQGMDFMSRNHINVLTAHVLIALPGGAGTHSEVLLRMQYGRPLILFLGVETVNGKTAQQIRKEATDPSLVLVAASLEDVPARIKQSLEIEAVTEANGG